MKVRCTNKEIVKRDSKMDGLTMDRTYIVTSTRGVALTTGEKLQEEYEIINDLGQKEWYLSIYFEPIVEKIEVKNNQLQMKSEKLKSKDLIGLYQQLEPSEKIKVVNFLNKESKMKRLQKLEQRACIAGSLMSNLLDEEGRPYLDINWVAKNIVGLSDEEIEENRANKK